MIIILAVLIKLSRSNIKDICYDMIKKLKLSFNRTIRSEHNLSDMIIRDNVKERQKVLQLQINNTAIRLHLLIIKLSCDVWRIFGAIRGSSVCHRSASFRPPPTVRDSAIQPTFLLQLFGIRFALVASSKMLMRNFKVPELVTSSQNHYYSEYFPK